MKVRTPNGKSWAVNWVSTAIAPDEMWLNMDTGENRIPALAEAFDRCKQLKVFQTNDEAGQTFEGYTLLTHAMLDGDTITLRLRKEES